MSKTINLGRVTAYADAVAAGYTGTREEFAQDLANAATYAAESHQSAETASAAATTASTAATTATTAASSASDDASTAHADAEAALSFKSAAETAATTATTKAGEAANSASQAATSASGAAGSATAASGSATAAAGSATNAAASETAAAGSATSAAGSASAAAQTLADVNTAGATQVAAIQAKGTEVLNSIPADYTTLSNDVDGLKSDLSNVETNLCYSEKTDYGRITDYSARSSTFHKLTRYNSSQDIPFYPLEYDKFELTANRSGLIGAILYLPKQLVSKKVTADFWVKSITDMQFRIWVGIDGTPTYFDSYSESSFYVGRTWTKNNIVWTIDNKIGDWWHMVVVIPTTGATQTSLTIGTSSGSAGGYYYFSRPRLVLDDNEWYIKYPAPELPKMLIQYKSVSGADASTEQVDVYTKNGDKYIKYEFVHTEDANINSDIWRIGYAYVTNLSLNILYPLTTQGEWEMAIKLAGGTDFIGGYMHGDEVLVADPTFFVNGRVAEITDYATLTEVEAFNVVQRSRMYDPDTENRQVAYHGSNHVFSTDGLEIKQNVYWIVDTALSNCYLAMLPIAQAVSESFWTNAQHDVTDINGTSHTETYASDATIYGDDVSCRFYVPVYPNIGYFFMTTNGGTSYNKCYFAINDNDGITHGDDWMSETKYEWVIK